MNAEIKIGGRVIGPGSPCFIIAEAGVNHNGSTAVAKQLVLQARQAGADCVKFQTFKAERVVTAAAPKADYQLKTTDVRQTQLEMLRGLELSVEGHREVFAVARAEGVTCLSTPYSEDDIDLLVELGCPALKIASGQIIELAFLERAARTGLPLILSTGMATMAEVQQAASVLDQAGCRDLLVLQCTTNYPSLVVDANLRVMDTFAKAFRVPVGYSDHTEGIACCVAATALGASAIEKHFTLDRKAPGPDHSSSSDPGEFRALVAAVRDIEAALGTGIKLPSEAEVRNARGMRRSLVTARPVSAGATLVAADVTCKRPSAGLAPALISQVIGRRAKVDLPADTRLDWSHFE